MARGYSVAISSDGQLVAGGDSRGNLVLHDWADHSERRFKVGKSVTGLQFTPDGRRLLATDLHEKALRVVDVETGEIVSEFPGHPDDGLRQVGFLPDGKTIYTVDGQSLLKLWRTE